MSSLLNNFRQILGLPKVEIRAWREIAFLAVLLMEMAWLVPWTLALLSIEQSISIWVTYFVFASLAIFTFFLMRILSLMSLRQSVRIAFLGLLLIIVTPIISRMILFPNQEPGYFQSISLILNGFQNTESLLPNEFLIVFALVIAWLRAIRWATSDGLPSEMLSSFRFGFLVLAVFIFVFIWRGQQSLAGFEIVFIFFALAAMASSRIARSEAHPAIRGKLFDGNWLLALMGLMLLFSVFLGILGWGITAQFELVRQMVFYLWLLFWGLVILILSPFLILISVIFEWLLSRVDPSVLSAMRGAFNQIFGNEEEEVAEVIEVVDGAGDSFLQQILDWLNSLSISAFLELMRPYFLWAVIAIFILFGLYFAGRRFAFWKAISDQISIRNSTNYDDDWLKNWRKNWRRRIGDLRDTLMRFADPNRGRKMLAAARIRRVYSYLMDLSSELGKQRKQAETPLEFMDVLNKIFPFHQLEVSTISKAYMRVRYGELDETPKDVIDVDRAWLQLRLEGQLLKRKQRRLKKEKKAKLKD